MGHTVRGGGGESSSSHNKQKFTALTNPVNGSNHSDSETDRKNFLTFTRTDDKLDKPSLSNSDWVKGLFLPYGSIKKEIT